MTLKGFDVLINEAAATRWLKRHSIWYRSLPMDYPCIVEERLDASKNGYPFYYYRETLSSMQKVLDSVQKPSTKEGRK